MQQLLDSIGSANGSTGVPSVITKHKTDDNDSLSSLKKSKGQSNDAAAFDKLSTSIGKHSHSLVAAAKITAMEQAKNCSQVRVSEIHERIFCLHDMKREMALCMSEPNVINNWVIVDAILHEMQGIKAEIASRTEEINLLMATPIKSNPSPCN
jgi:hypothetical protein